MTARIDWPGLLKAGLNGLGLEPAVFWRLTPVELRIMLGAEQAVPPLTRARLAELAAAFPDTGQGADDDRSGGSDGSTGGAGGKAWHLGGDGGGL